MPLAEAADGGVARHGADGRDAVGHERRPGAHAGCGGCGLATGMATADYDDVEGLGHGEKPLGNERKL